MKRLYVKILFAGIVFILSLVSFAMYRNLENYMEEVESVRHSNDIIEATQLVMSLMKDAETGSRGYQLTGDTSYLNPYFDAIKILPDHLHQLDSLVADNKVQRAGTESLKKLVSELFMILANLNANVSRESLFMDRYESELLSRGKTHMDKIRENVDVILAEELEVMNRRADYESSYRVLTPISLLIYTLLAIGATVFLFTRILFALDKSVEAEALLSENLVKQKLQTAVIEESKIILNEAEKLTRMGSWKWSEKSDEMVWSDGLYSILGKEKGDIISFETFLENVLYDDKKLVEEFLREARTERKVRQLDFRITKDDKIGYLSITSKPQQFEGNNIILGAVVDITESKLNEKQLQQYNAELKRSNEDLEQFAYVASHDLQEPLRKIRAFGDRLVTKYGKELKDQGADYINRMQAAASRMQLLIEDLLSFSRLSRASAEYEILDAKEVIAEVLDDLDHQVKREKAQIKVSDIPWFYGDKLQVKRLFQNLIGNAVKFHKENEKPIIHINARLMEKQELEDEFGPTTIDEEFVRISIKDNGIGFDEKYAEKIFNIFQRLNGRTAYEGTGIGLAICRKIVSNHKGYISAKSIESVGSEFIVIFPRDITKIQ